MDSGLRRNDEQMPDSLQSIDLLIEARWVVPVEPHGVVLEDHAVAIDRDRIVAVLPIGEAQARYAPRERVELAEHALIPGLVNAHTHNPMTLMRGLADDLPLMRWLQGTHLAGRSGIHGPGVRARRHRAWRSRDAARRHHLLQRKLFFPGRAGGDLSPARLPRDGRLADHRVPDRVGTDPR